MLPLLLFGITGSSQIAIHFDRTLLPPFWYFRYMKAPHVARMVAHYFQQELSLEQVTRQDAVLLQS